MQGKSSFDGKENQPVATATTSVPTAQQIRGPTFPTLHTSQPQVHFWAHFSLVLEIATLQYPPRMLQ